MKIIGLFLVMSLSSLTAFADSQFTPAQALAMGAALDAVCPSLEQEAGLVQLIAEERANPAGVVSLSKLHELGESLAFTRAEIKQARAENAAGLAIVRRFLKRPLDLGFCQTYDARKAAE